MIEPIHWRLLGGEDSPFNQGGRHLRVTVYCPSTGELSGDESFGLALLRELAYLDSLRIADTHQAAPWRMEINTQPNAHGVAEVDLIGPEDRRVHMGMHPRDWIEEAVRLLPSGGPADARTGSLASHLPFLEAHRQTHRDLFVTNCRDLLECRQRLPDANVRPVGEGLKIIGLYLRVVGDFTTHASARGRAGVDRALFYWVLCRHRLPAMWRYFDACLRRGRAARDNTDYLGNTILDRCVRVLQARDEVGFQFYQEQNNSTRDEMLYHFDYLTLMLSGALDAQARVARLSYDLALPQRSASFRNPQFLEDLAAAGANELCEVVTRPTFQSFQRFLGALRNTVHSVSLRGVGVSRAGQSQSSLVQVFEGAETVWEESALVGSREDLGATNEAGVAIEPYTCAVRLTDLGLRYVDEVAEATNIGRLLPAGITVDELLNGPPDDGVFGSETRRRIDALG